MSLARRILLVLVLVAVSAACAERTVQSTQFFVFGTLVEVSLPDAGPGEASEIFSRLQREFQRMHDEWHAWQPGELVTLNRALQTGEAVSTTADILELVRRSQAMEARSGGLFNAAIGKTVALWGFHTSDFPIPGPPPRAEDIRTLVEAKPSALDVHISDTRLYSSNPVVQFDFGGIAKGYAADLACAIIRDSGQVSAIVNAGGDLRTMGNNRGKPWRVAVRNPAGGVAGTIAVSGDFAVFTSGNYTRFREDSGQRYPHILDPRTGWPVSGISSATVIARDGSTADAAATAIVVAGPDQWPQLANDMGIKAVLVMDESGAMQATAPMMAFFTPAAGLQVEIVEPGEDL